MGIALGHARLLIETFVQDTKKNDLAKCVTSLRSDRTKKNKSVMPINIDLGWKHFDHKKRKYTTVPASHGGGTCLLYTSPSPRDKRQSRMPSSA